MTDDSPMYQIVYDPRALKELARLDKSIVRRVNNAVMALAGQPRPVGCRPLTGYPGLWRVRVGDYRIIYGIEDQRLAVLVLRVTHRREVYRDL